MNRTPFSTPNIAPRPLAVLYALLLLPQAALAGPLGTAFTYQGRLTSGASPANGLYDFTFALYDAATNGNQLGAAISTNAVGVTNGLFSLALDFGSQFNGPACWLDIAVRTNGAAAFTELSPRQPLLPVPYSLMAASASNLLGSLPATQLSGLVANGQLANSTVAVNAGAGLSGGGVVALGGTITLDNGGVLSVTGNADITATPTSGNVVLGTTATDANTAGLMVKRDASGSFAAGTISANLSGNATTATTAAFVTGNNTTLTNAFNLTNAVGQVVPAQIAGTLTNPISGNAASATTANNFSGSLAGDVTGPQSATVVGTVGGVTAANLAAGANAANAATSANMAGAIIARDASGSFAAGTVSANLSGNATTATTAAFVTGNSTTLTNAFNLTNAVGQVVPAQIAGTLTNPVSGNAASATTANNFSGSLAGDVTGPQSATLVGTVGGVTAANLAAGANAANAATSANMAGAIIARDASGNFAAGTITANLSGNATSATTANNFSGWLAGDVTGPQSATVVGTVGGVAAANVASGANAANAATSADTAGAIVKRDASGNFGAGSITLAGDLNLPATTSSSAGVIGLGGSPFLHAYGIDNTFVGLNAGNFTMSGSDNTASGAFALLNNSSGYANTANGLNALYDNTAGIYNTASGYEALYNNTIGSFNTAQGDAALAANTSGSCNTADGYHALGSNTSGSNNIALGYLAGYGLTTGNNNIDIGNVGASGESGVIRLGAPGTHTSAFIAGIAGTTVTAGALVYVDADGQLGTSASSPVALLNANETFSGAVTFNNPADSFTGNGSGLTSLNAAQLVGTAPSLTLSGDLNLPATTGSGAGVINSGGTPLLHAYGSYNTFVGPDAGNFTMTGSYNTASGQEALYYNTSGSFNTANGFMALIGNRVGSYNTAVGADALIGNISGIYNIALGYQAGWNVTTNGYNIDIGNQGVAGDSGVIRIGTPGTQISTFIAGISGATVAGGAPAFVNANGQLGSVANPPASFTAATLTLTGDLTLPITTGAGAGVINLGGSPVFHTYGDNYGLQNTFVGPNAGNFTAVWASNNTACGAAALNAITGGSGNTANGSQALQANTSGSGNTASGAQALQVNTSGGVNTAVGSGALGANTSGSGNTAVGSGALGATTTGNNNIALGYQAGCNLVNTTNIPQNNIDIGNAGMAGESQTIRIGTSGTHTRTLIAGISGVAVSGSTVTVDSSGHLGVAPSSARFKRDIRSMGDASDALLALRPVTFHYRPDIDRAGTAQFGLIAEEVEQVNPDLVARDAGGKPFTVRYEAVNAMLLNEFLKQHRQVKEQQAQLERQQAEILDLQRRLLALEARLVK